MFKIDKSSVNAMCILHVESLKLQEEGVKK